jgi:hypothetical protein
MNSLKNNKCQAYRQQAYKSHAGRHKISIPVVIAVTGN